MKKIIFIEDETQDFERFSKWMVDTGYELNSLAQSIQLIEELKQSNTDRTNIFKEWFFQIDNIDNVVAFVLDIHLKINDFDGLDIKNLIRQNITFPKVDLNQIPIFILTSDSEKDGIAHENVNESPNRYIVKDEISETTFLNKLQIEITKNKKDSKLSKIHNVVNKIDKKTDQILNIVKSLNANEKTDFEKTLNNILSKDNATKDVFVDNFVQDLQNNNSELYTKILDSGKDFLEVIQQYCITNNDTFSNAQNILETLKHFN